MLKLKMKKYQIYCDRGNGEELGGCWGSEHAKFYSKEEANQAAYDLSKLYPDVKWVIRELNEN